MITLKNPVIVTIDVDDTLVLWKDREYTTNWKVYNQLVRHKIRGHYVIVWSAGGAEWAKKIVDQMDIAHLVDVVMAKPAFMWDDKDPNEWTRVCYDK